jgi:hypothetical protein
MEETLQFQRSPFAIAVVVSLVDSGTRIPLAAGPVSIRSMPR